jgi:hypothetical protein
LFLGGGEPAHQAAPVAEAPATTNSPAFFTNDLLFIPFLITICLKYRTGSGLPPDYFT